MTGRLFATAVLLLAALATATAREIKASPEVAALVTQCAQRYSMPEALLHSVIRRESGYNAGARHGPYWGLMQIRVDTARGVGYRGAGQGLLDPATNLTYGGAYLANAWRVSGGKQARAMSLYRGGYYYEAKRKGMLKQLIRIP